MFRAYYKLVLGIVNIILLYSFSGVPIYAADSKKANIPHCPFLGTHYLGQGVQSSLLHICVPGMESNRYFLNAITMPLQS